MMIKLYYDDAMHSIYIDEPSKQTKIELPADVARLDACYAIQSDAVYQIIKQLKEKGDRWNE